ncbi:MAG: hypothetical protein V4503_06250 [Gemmatimonadota bacterium]
MPRLSQLPLHGSRAFVVVLLTAACSGTPTEPAAPPPPPLRIEVVSGASQAGETGDSLTFPIDLRVSDSAGAPMPGERVVWHAVNGLPGEDTTRTASDGRTSVTLELGENPGIATLVARVVGRSDSIRMEFEVRADPSTDIVLPVDRFVPLDLRTYDGSGETVHPDYVAAPDVGRFGQVLVVTPYPQGNRVMENPSIYFGAGTWRWRRPLGLHNPVVTPPASSYLSDPDVIFNDATQEIWLYYRQVEPSNDIYLIRSLNGVKWSAPELVLSAPRDQVVSPAVVRRSVTDWLMWAVDAGAYGCGAASTRVMLRHSRDGLTWGPPEEVTFSAGAPMAWHLDVQWIPSKAEYWALYSAKPNGNCSTPALMFARSADGVQWTVRDAPVVGRGMSREIADIIYRGTFRYDPADDDLLLWISGAAGSGGVYTWKTVFGRMKGAELMGASIRSPAPWAFTPSQPLLLEGP